MEMLSPESWSTLAEAIRRFSGSSSTNHTEASSHIEAAAWRVWNDYLPKEPELEIGNLMTAVNGHPFSFHVEALLLEAAPPDLLAGWSRTELWASTVDADALSFYRDALIDLENNDFPSLNARLSRTPRSRPWSLLWLRLADAAWLCADAETAQQFPYEIQDALDRLPKLLPSSTAWYILGSEAAGRLLLNLEVLANSEPNDFAQLALIRARAIATDPSVPWEAHPLAARAVRRLYTRLTEPDRQERSGLTLVANAAFG